MTRQRAAAILMIFILCLNPFGISTCLGLCGCCDTVALCGIGAPDMDMVPQKETGSPAMDCCGTGKQETPSSAISDIRAFLFNNSGDALSSLCGCETLLAQSSQVVSAGRYPQCNPLQIYPGVDEIIYNPFSRPSPGHITKNEIMKFCKSPIYLINNTFLC